MGKSKNQYNPAVIEPYWQKQWEESGIYQAIDFGPPVFDREAQTESAGGPKKYILIEFPYPSGERLHVGHGRSYSALDAVSRKLRMQGFNVLYPFGWDAFGLPAENYAIKTGVNPAVTTAKNIENSKKQAKSWGLSFDWSREVNTTDPKYYKWTQWIFIKMFEKGLAYQAEVPVNWCPFCKTNLADEEVLADGTHERCGTQTERRMQKQWLLRITDYADRLLEDLKNVDYLPKIRIQQENWIGRSEGVKITFKTNRPEVEITVFTTALDTIFGTSFMVVSPEVAKDYLSYIDEDKKESVSEYINQSLKKSELERQSEEKVKTGVKTGLKAINPFNNREIPVLVADYVLSSYGTGAVMGVPGHDARDYEFANKYNFEILNVIKPKDKDLKEDFWNYLEIKANPEMAVLVNSDSYNGLTSYEAKKKLEEELVKRGIGEKTINYHLRDWVFSRQHYWGEPIPIIHCQNCGPVPVPEKELPVELPYLEKYQPTGTGESPLAQVTEWVNTACPECNGPARRETDTMPNWAGSNWYYLRYCDPDNDQSLADRAKLDYWMPVDLYNGGMEHTTLHLLYSRFIYKFLSDIGMVPGNEPYARRHSHGVVLGPDGQKMSKSRGNVVNPDDVISKYGADTFRLYEMFMGPFEQMISWDDRSLAGCHRFLRRIWQLAHKSVRQEKTPKQVEKKLHQTIKKVTEDLETLKFNTAIASMMEFVNLWSNSFLSQKEARIFLQILAPFAPHITEELWQRLKVSKVGKVPKVSKGGGNLVSAQAFDTFGTSDTSFSSIHQSSWPQFDPKLIKEDVVTIVVQVNGKIKEKLLVERGKGEERSVIEKMALESAKMKVILSGKKAKNVIFVPGKLINFVI